MHAYLTGFDRLLSTDDDLLGKRSRIGLVCHPASVNRRGAHSATSLRDRIGTRLVWLAGPEHGYLGTAGPGEAVEQARHPHWGIPVYSLYGPDAEKSLCAMASTADTIIVDLQDLGVRCYTYLHTLHQILQLTAQHDVRVIVTDRAVPLARCVDGPMLDPAYTSVVAPLNVPYVYGMTPGETTRWWMQRTGTEADITVVQATGFQRATGWQGVWEHWIPPSPAIRSLQCAGCFPLTVFTESWMHLDCARESDQAFCVLRGIGDQTDTVYQALLQAHLPGLRITGGDPLSGISFEVEDDAVYCPAYAMATVLWALGNALTPSGAWDHPRVRLDWFDKLMGTAHVRAQLQAGASPCTFADEWHRERQPFEEERNAVLMY